MNYILNRFINFIIYLLCLLAIIHVTPAASTCFFDDWISSPQSHPLCQGYYLQEPLPFPHLSKELLKQQPISLSADQGAFTQAGNSILTGHVHLIQGNTQAFSNQAIIHRNPKEAQPIDWVQAIGNVKIIEPDLRVDGTNAEILTKTNTKIINHADYRLYNRHARGCANNITIYDQTKMVLKNATYTTCNPFQNTWYLKASKVTLNKKTGRGQATHARLYVYKLPVFYFPYVDFPIDNRRQTGFLFPAFGTSNQSGAEFSAPFYWNIAPNYDATFTPRLFGKRGLELQGQFRYLLPKSSGELEGSILPNDRAYRQFRENHLINHPLIANNDPRVTALNTGNNREAFRIKHSTTFNENWSTNVQYHTVEDDNYFMDFGSNIGMASTTQLLQQGELLYQSNHWNVQSRLQQYQTLHPFKGPVTGDVYKRLPQIAFNASYPDLPHGLDLRTNGEFSHFAHQRNPYTGEPVTVGNRFHLRPDLSLPIKTPGWYLTPRIQYDMLAYSLSVGPGDANTIRAHATRLLPMYDLDSGLIFERNIHLKGEPYIQTLEPRAYYVYIPFRNQNTLPIFDTAYPGFGYNQLYWDNRFTGFDRLGDTNHLTLGLTSRFFPEKTGSERLSLTAGQIFYFADRKVTLCNPNTNPLCAAREHPGLTNHRSAFVGLARYLLQEYWTANANAEWDPYKKRADKTVLTIQYHPDVLSVFNLGYQYLRHNPAQINPNTGFGQRLRQTDTSFAWPVTEQWRLLGRWHYDLHNHRSNDISMGIEQQGCCTAVRLFVTRFLPPFDANISHNEKKYSKGFFLQFIFKGFAGIGHNRLDDTLGRSIPGYHWHQDGF